MEENGRKRIPNWQKEHATIAAKINQLPVRTFTLHAKKVCTMPAIIAYDIISHLPEVTGLINVQSR